MGRRRVEFCVLLICDTGHAPALAGAAPKEVIMDSIIYLVGLVVVVMFILSVLGLR